MHDDPRVNDLVDGDHPAYGEFRGVVTMLQNGSIEVFRLPDQQQPEPIPVQIAYVAVLGYCSVIAVLSSALTVLQHDAIPLQP